MFKQIFKLQYYFEKYFATAEIKFPFFAEKKNFFPNFDTIFNYFLSIHLFSKMAYFNIIFSSKFSVTQFHFFSI